MATYNQLRDEVLRRCGALGEVEAQDVVQAALVACMRFVSFHVRIPSLIGSATATAPASPTLEANAIPLYTTGFTIPAGQFQVPDRLYVKKDSSTEGQGTPFDFREYHHFLDELNAPRSERVQIFAPGTLNELPRFPYTITPSNKLWALNIVEDNVLTLYYRKVPADYSPDSSPEITPLFDHILTSGAELALKEFLKEPAALTHLWQLFTDGLMPQIESYDSHINGSRKRRTFKIHRSYRIC